MLNHTRAAVEAIPDEELRGRVRAALSADEHLLRAFRFNAVVWTGRGEQEADEGAKFLHRLRDAGFSAALMSHPSGEWQIDINTSLMSFPEDRVAVSAAYEAMLKHWRSWPDAVKAFDAHRAACQPCRAVGCRVCDEGAALMKVALDYPPYHRRPRAG
jgi:proteasome lid subunit RPN8/RPN11